MPPDTETMAKERLRPMIEDFGRFNPAKTAEPDDPYITDDEIDEAYEEGNGV